MEPKKKHTTEITNIHSPNHQSAFSNPLFGITVLITRTKEQSSSFRLLLEARGATVICFPTIEITDPESWQECDTAIWKLAEYSAVCFTSKNGVMKFIQRIRSIRPQAVDTLATRNIFAIGEKTKSCLVSCGFPVLASPQNASMKELVVLLQAHQVTGTKILFPKSAIARNKLPDQLRTMGATVDEVIVYRTIIPEHENLDHIQSELREKKINVVTFFSPSSIVNFAEILGMELLMKVTIAVIGNTTAESAKQLGLHKIIIAKQTTPEGFVKTLEEHFSIGTER